MFDTITFALSKQYFDKQKLENLLTNKFKFNSKKEYVNGKTKSYTYKNWNFWLTENYLNFSGSLTNLILDNNYENLSFQEAKASLWLLEGYLEISLSEALIRRIDISCTVDMDNDVSDYLNFLLPPKNCKSHIHGVFETVELTHKRVVNSKFYNKTREHYEKNKSIELEGTNKLKYEMQVPCNVSTFFNLDKLAFKHLFDRNVYNKLITKCWENYLSIPHNETSLRSYLDCSSFKNFQTGLAMEAVAMRGGIDAVDVILRDDKRISKWKRFRMRNYLRDNFKKPPSPSFLKKELDYKIQEAFETTLKDVR